MSLSEHEKIRRTAAVVAVRYLRGALPLHTAGWSMDELARLSILEGAAGKSPGTWLRHKARGFGSALEFFGPKLSAAWTSTRDQGVYNKAVTTAAKALRSVQGMEPMDLVQNLTVNSTTTSGADRSRIFHSIGKKIQSHRNDLGQGDIGPTDWRVMNSINSWVNNAAQDEARSLRERRTVPLHGDRPHGTDPLRRLRTTGLDDDERENLLLLALQSPGGPGLEVRRIVDRLIDQSFPTASRAVVRAFIEKMAQPKYRSPDQMRKLVDRFEPSKWFKQALVLVRRELTAEMGLTSQQLTNALGGDAKKVFRFMRERVGRDSRVKGIVDDLARKIELLEPGVSVVARRRDPDDAREREAQLREEQKPKMPYSVMQRWLEKNDDGEREAQIQEWFEKDEHDGWTEQATPHVQHSRGAVPLRVAGAWLGTIARGRGASMRRVADYRPAFKRWVEGRHFQQPETRNDVLFVSLPNDEKKRIYAQWQQDRLDWAQRHKPESLSDDTRITAENFDELRKGDVVWTSWSPVVLHKVVAVDRAGPRRNNPIAELVQFDPRNSGREGETRHMHKSTLRNQMMEAHKVPKEREEVMRQLPQEPSGGWPEFTGFLPLRHSDDRQKIQALFKDVAGEDLQGVTYSNVARRVNDALGRDDPRVAREMLVKLGAWADELAGAAREAGPSLERERAAFRAVRLKVDEGMRKADEKIRERSQAIQSLIRGLPVERMDMHDARLQLEEQDRKKFSGALRKILTHGWKPGHEGIDNLRELGRKHLGDKFTNGVWQDLLGLAWGARASRLDEDGVRDIRETVLNVREAIGQGQAERPARAPSQRPSPPSEAEPSPRRREPAAPPAGVFQTPESRPERRPERRPAPPPARPGIFQTPESERAQEPASPPAGAGVFQGPEPERAQEPAAPPAGAGIFESPPPEGDAAAEEGERDRARRERGRERYEDPPTSEQALGWANEHAKPENMPGWVGDEQGYRYWITQAVVRNMPMAYPDFGWSGFNRWNDALFRAVDDVLQKRGIGESWRRERAVPAGRHRDRDELRGKPKQGVSGTTRVRPSQALVNLGAPSGLSPRVRYQMRRKMRDLTLDGAKDLFRRINHAIQEPDGEYMQGLERSGYTDENLKTLRKTLKKHIVPYVGRRYDHAVLALANNYGLESEDADALHDFRVVGPARGDARTFKKFLAKAKPETRERMRGMRPQDFTDMYEAITAEDEEEDVL